MRRQMYVDRSQIERSLTPPEFIQRHYAAEIEAKILHRGIIRREDPELYKALVKWLRTHALPDGLKIPTLPEWNSERLAKFGGRLTPGKTISLLIMENDPEERERIARLYEVAKKRPRHR